MNQKIIHSNLKKILELALERNHTFTTSEALMYDPIIAPIHNMIKFMENEGIEN